MTVYTGSVCYRFLQVLKKLDAYLEKIRDDGNAISQAAPWVEAQAKLVGPEYCAAFIIRNGALKLMTLSKSSASQLRFEHIENTKVNIWLEQFVTRTNDLVKIKSKTDEKQFKKKKESFDVVSHIEFIRGYNISSSYLAWELTKLTGNFTHFFT